MGQAVGLRLQCGRGDKSLLFISVKQLYTGIMKEDVSWHWRLNFLYWTISCESSCCPSVYFTTCASCVFICIHMMVSANGASCKLQTVTSLPPSQVIYELTQGERQLIEDLSLVKKVIANKTLPPGCNTLNTCEPLIILTSCSSYPDTSFSHFCNWVASLCCPACMHVCLFVFVCACMHADRCTMSPCWSWTSWRRVSLDRSLVLWTPSFPCMKVNHLALYSVISVSTHASATPTSVFLVSGNSLILFS